MNNFLYRFTHATTVTIPGALHKLQTLAIWVNVYAEGPPWTQLFPEICVDPQSYDVVLHFRVLTLAPDTDAGVVETWLPPQTGVAFLSAC